MRYRACSAPLGSAHLHSGVLGIFEALYDKECCDAVDNIIGQCLCVFTVAPLLCTTLSSHDTDMATLNDLISLGMDEDLDDFDSEISGDNHLS